MTIEIKNKLEILPGGVIRIPSCEPTSAFSSLSIAANINCDASIISLEDALAAIPGSRIVRVLKPAGVPGTGRYFELPAGPPRDGNGCPPECLTDFYKILKEAATPITFDENYGIPDSLKSCSGLSFTGKVNEKQPFNRAPDPTLRPNTNPLGGVF